MTPQHVTSGDAAASAVDKEAESPRGRTRPVAVVTGASAGVGRATARALAQHGYDVAVLARGEAGIEGAAEDVRGHGSRTLALQVDVSDAQAVREAAATVETRLGEIALWVNCAFVGTLAFSWDTPLEEFRRVTEVSYYGQVHGTIAALEYMRPRNRGVIINVGSAMSVRAIPLQAAYCGAKHAVKGFTESVITELAHENSRIALRMIELPGLNTPQFNWNATRMRHHPMPVPPIFQPELAARAIVYQAEHPRRMMWVGPSAAYTVLGERLAPRFMDWYLARSGISGQQTEADLPRWGSNLFQPRDQDVDRGAHGPFDAWAHHRDPWSWLSMHRREALGVATGLAGAVALATRSRRRGGRRDAQSQ